MEVVEAIGNKKAKTTKTTNPRGATGTAGANRKAENPRGVAKANHVVVAAATAADAAEALEAHKKLIDAEHSVAIARANVAVADAKLNAPTAPSAPANNDDRKVDVPTVAAEAARHLLLPNIDNITGITNTNATHAPGGSDATAKATAMVNALQQGIGEGGALLQAYPASQQAQLVQHPLPLQQQEQQLVAFHHHPQHQLCGGNGGGHFTHQPSDHVERSDQNDPHPFVSQNLQQQHPFPTFSPFAPTHHVPSSSLQAQPVAWIIEQLGSYDTNSNTHVGLLGLLQHNKKPKPITATDDAAMMRACPNYQAYVSGARSMGSLLVAAGVTTASEYSAFMGRLMQSAEQDFNMMTQILLASF